MKQTKGWKNRQAGIYMLGLIAAGCTAAPQPFDPVAIQAPERAAVGHEKAEQPKPLPTTLESPWLGKATTLPTTQESAPRDVVRLTLEQIVHRAVVNNYDIKVAGYSPAIEQTRVVEAEAQFDPVFFLNASAQITDNQTGGSIVPTFTSPSVSIPVYYDQSTVYGAQAGIRQNLITGGRAQIAYQTTRNDIDPQRTIKDPYWESDLILQLTQPLLRNFGTDVNRAQIVVQRNTQRISLLDFRQQLEKSITDIEQTYWQLVEAENNVRIFEELLDRTVQTADILAKRARQDVTRVQISQANASVESRRATLVRARARIGDLSDKLKQLMNDPDYAISGPIVILPASQPLEAPVAFDLDDQIRTAMLNRPELGQQQLRVDSATTIVGVARNNLLPQLNLIGSIGVQGANGNYSGALRNEADFDYLSYSVGVQLEVPLGNRAARAAYQRSLLQRQQAIDSYAGVVSQVVLDVKTALREVRTSWEEMRATRQARFAAADSLLAIQQREDANEPLTPTFVQLKLDTQASLASAEQAESQAIVNYNVAIAALERAKGTLLNYNNVAMQELAPGRITRPADEANDRTTAITTGAGQSRN